MDGMISLAQVSLPLVAIRFGADPWFLGMLGWTSQSVRLPCNIGSGLRSAVECAIITDKGGEMDYNERIVRSRNVCGGEPVIRGTRVTLRTILASLAEGAAIREILDDFPTLTEEDLRAAIAFAAASAQEDLPVAGLPNVA